MDFVPQKDSFHFMLDGAAQDCKLPKVHIHELKAVFFVRDFTGNPYYQDKKEIEAGKPIAGRKIKVLFKDGEQIVGTTSSYQSNRPGFFVSPADSQSNIERCFVVTRATSDVTFL